MLANTLSKILDILPSNSSLRTQFRQFVSIARKKYQPFKSWEPKQMKAFFSLHLVEEIWNLFQSYDKFYLVPWVSEQQIYHFKFMEVYQIVGMVLDSIRVYFDFAYKQHPTIEDFSILHMARQCILAGYATFHWSMEPTTHYMMNTFLWFAHQDGSSYHCLQEGAEHKNKQDKQDSHQTMGHIRRKQDGKTCWDTMLEIQAVRRELLKRGYQHENNCILSWQNSSKPASYTISPPVFVMSISTKICSHW